MLKFVTCYRVGKKWFLAYENIQKSLQGLGVGIGSRANGASFFGEDLFQKRWPHRWEQNQNRQITSAKEWGPGTAPHVPPRLYQLLEFPYGFNSPTKRRWWFSSSDQICTLHSHYSARHSLGSMGGQTTREMVSLLAIFLVYSRPRPAPPHLTLT